MKTKKISKAAFLLAVASSFLGYSQDATLVLEADSTISSVTILLESKESAVVVSLDDRVIGLKCKSNFKRGKERENVSYC